MDVGNGTVKIIPASALRDQPLWFDLYSSAEHPTSYPQPINAAYYMPGMYNAGYVHEPYGQNAYIDTGYGDPQQWPYYGGYGYQPYAYQGQPATAYPGAYGPYPGASGAYRPYPQPQPSPPRRSRTAPGRTAQRSTASGYQPEPRRTRGFSSDPFDRRQYKAYSHHQPRKPLPIYKKRQPTFTTKVSGNIQETDFGGGGNIDYGSQFGRQYYPQEATPTLRRIRPFYAPSYTTYPPSTMHRTHKKLDTTRYPIWARAIVKLAQLLLGAAILGLVLGPMKDESFYSFVIRTNTEWQGLIIGLVSAWAIFTLVLLLTVFLADRFHGWRKVDAHLTLYGIFAYFIISFLEAYYAACYPPNGPRLKLVCHRAEWIIADILAFINLVLYIVDFAMAWLSGVNML